MGWTRKCPGEMNSSGWNLLEFMWKVLMILVTCAYVIDLISHKIHRIPLIPKEPASALVPEAATTVAPWFKGMRLVKDDTGLESTMISGDTGITLSRAETCEFTETIRRGGSSNVVGAIQKSGVLSMKFKLPSSFG